MENRAYYLRRGAKLDRALAEVRDTFPCFIETEPIKMDWVRVVIKSREEDTIAIDKHLQRAYQGRNFN